ncbi:MAG: DUF2238 domain-containing protein [Phycisphaerales bacterium]|nr:DUF2238 domain-containing protein [Phycisphaerales bacterium]
MTRAARDRVVPMDVLVVNALNVGVAAGAAVVTGNREFLFYVVVLAVLLAIGLAVHVRVGFSPWVLRGLTLWAVLHMAGGLVPVPAGWPINGEQRVLYSWWLVPDRLKYDQVVHAFGFGVTTWAFWQGLRRMTHDSVHPTLGALFTCACAAMGCGALNEVVEFVAVLTMPKTNVGGYDNTGWDLVSNTAGAVFAAFLIRLGALR